jgi:hypothetical protein
MNCNVVGFDDMYCCLFLIPITVCLLVIVGLSWEIKFNVSNDLYRMFEVV